jgi:CheY-like chemotaxis protein
MTTSPPAAEGSPAARRRVSVVNDNPEFLELMQDILEGDHYDVSIINGERISGIEPIRATHPELLIVDLRLLQPTITGWDIAKQVRADPELARIPMILCTGAPDEVRERAAELAELPNVEVLAKPFAVGELESMVARLLEAEGIQD